MTAVVERQDLWRSMPGWGIVANLLPPELIDARRAKTLRKMIAAVAVVIVVLTTLGYFYESWKAHSASSALGKAQDTSIALTGEQSDYSAVVKMQADVANLHTQIGSLMVGDVDFSSLVGQVRGDLGAGMAVTQLSVSVNGGATASTGGAGASSGGNGGSSLDTSGQAHIGTITLNGTARHFSDVAAYVDLLGTITGVVQVFPVSDVAGANGVQFSLQMTVTDAALSHHFATSSTKAGGH